MSSAVARRPALLVVLLLGTAFGLLAAKVWSVTRPTESTAVTTAFVSTQGVEPVVDLQREAGVTAQVRESLAAVATSPIVLQPVIDHLRLQRTVDSLARHISIDLPSGTAVMTVAATDPDPRRAAAISDQVAARLAAATARLQPAATGSVPLHLTVIESARTQTSSSAPILVVGACGGAALAAIALLARRSRRRRPPSARTPAAPSML